jgi:hypothetical protein
MSKIKEYYHDLMEEKLRDKSILHIRIDNTLKARLTASAKASGLNISELIRFLILKHLGDLDFKKDD